MSRYLLLVTGAGVSGTPPPDPGPSGPRAVSDNAGTYRLATTTADQVTYQMPHTIRRAVSRFRVYYQSNWWGAAGSQVNLVLDGAAVVVGGVLRPLTFAGAASATITPGSFLISDWVNVPVTAGTVISSRTCWAAGTIHPKHAWGSWTTTNGAGRPVAPFGNYTVSGSGAIPTLNVTENGHGPLMIEGDTTSTSPSIALIGDSICEGADDTGDPHGFLARGVGQNLIPWTNFGVFADTVPIAALPLGREGRYGDTLALHQHAVCEYPINTINQGNSFASNAATLLTFWTWVKGKGPQVWQTTLSPSNRSTDSWATLVNQTPGLTSSAHEAVRVALNDWFRDGAPTVSGVAVAAGSVDPTAIRAGAGAHPLAGYIEVADTVESARNSGLWKVSGAANYMTDDGTHPSTAAHTLMAVPVAAWAAAR